MNRVLLSPVAPPAEALAELKQWLAITTNSDDAVLTALLAASLDVCEAFTGALPIETAVEERLPRIAAAWHGCFAGTWQTLSTRPVQAITAIDALAADGTRTPLDPSQWEAELEADGTGRVRLIANSDAVQLAVRFSAGMAADWASLPDGLRHGVMRLGAHQYRERDSEGAAPLPPASVAALWRPWRRIAFGMRPA